MAYAIRRVCIIGGGTMGRGIIAAFLNADFRVTIVEQNEKALEAAKTGVSKIVHGDQLRRNLDAGCVGIPRSPQADQIDLFVECVHENMVLKKKIMTNVDSIAKAGALLATNTSTLNIDEVHALIKEGILPSTIDSLLESWGFMIGPLKMEDLIGLDLLLDISAQNGWDLRSGALGKLVESGRMGRKTGKGWYRFDPVQKRMYVDTEVAEIVRDCSAEVRHSFRCQEEVVERTLYPLVNEGFKIIEERIVQRAADIDMMWVTGYGWPEEKCGPIRWAFDTGLKKIVAELDKLHSQTGSKLHEPAKLLLELSGTPFHRVSEWLQRDLWAEEGDSTKQPGTLKSKI